MEHHQGRVPEWQLQARLAVTKLAAKHRVHNSSVEPAAGIGYAAVAANPARLMDVGIVLTKRVVTDGRPTLGPRSREGTQATIGRRGVPGTSNGIAVTSVVVLSAIFLRAFTPVVVPLLASMQGYFIHGPDACTPSLGGA